MDELTGEQLASMFSSLQKLDLRANQLSDGAVSKFAQAFRYVQKSVVKLKRGTILEDFLNFLNILNIEKKLKGKPLDRGELSCHRA